MTVGFGYDSHRLIRGRKLILGGVELPSSHGAQAHSDGDTLIHALIDALLGASGLGDIGQHYPPGQPETQGISSRLLLRETAQKLKTAAVTLINLDCVVLLDKPKILPFVDQIKINLSRDLSLPPEKISVKGKTREGLRGKGLIGGHRAVEAFAVVLVE